MLAYSRQGQEARPGGRVLQAGLPVLRGSQGAAAGQGFDPIEIPLENKVRGRVIGAVSGKGTAPQVFINGSLIGGLDDLKAHFA